MAMPSLTESLSFLITTNQRTSIIYVCQVKRQITFKTSNNHKWGVHLTGGMIGQILKLRKKEKPLFFTDRTPPKKLCWDRESGIEAERSVIREAIKTLK